MTTLLSNPELVLTDYTGTQLASDVLLKRLEHLAFCVTDAHGRFVEVNRAYEQLYGYSWAELQGQHFSMVVPEENRAYASGLHNEFISGLKEMPAEWEVMAKDGTLIRIHAEAIRIEDEEGQPSKLTVIERLS